MQRGQVNDILFLKERVYHALFQARGTAQEQDWSLVYIACFDAVAGRTRARQDEREAIAARLRCAAALPACAAAAQWRAAAWTWIWTVLRQDSPEQVATDLSSWRTLPHERIRQLGLFRSILAQFRRHPELMAVLPAAEQAELARWLAVPLSMR
ncbi:hypothetical protein GO986_00285 [Deinococcus sp. HMF7620]|uniref:Uncharacterized protein n=1 Tax=Deinococcus arboris TaxID=2682977 RepID=A0A7C9HPG9_9DEIO|nr:hypothetical protein [Deinococcus arboris]MVN85207.1 hypothetical protein [Deinococcus arboris]